VSRVVVVGAGVIGLWCALELRGRGADVVVLDKGRPGAGCSAGNAGWIVPSLSGPLPAPGLRGRLLRWAVMRAGPVYVAPRADPELLQWVWRFWGRCNATDYARGFEAIVRFHEESRSLYDVAAQQGLEFELHRTGLLFLFLGRSEQHHIRRDLARLAARGYEVAEELDARAVQALEPAVGRGVVGGILAKGDWHVRPESLTAALAERLRILGVPVRTDVDVQGFDVAGGRVMACRTCAGRVAFDQCVIAAGAWSGPLLRQVGYRLPVQAGKGYSVTVTPPPFRVHRPLYLAEAKVACSPFRGAIRMAGTMEFSGLNVRLDRRRVAAMDRAVARFLPGWRSRDAGQEWVGMRAVTPDGLPVIGQVPGFDNLYVATGHAMLGVSLAPATARGVGRLLAGERPALLAPFDPARFAGRTAGARGPGSQASRGELAGP